MSNVKAPAYPAYWQAGAGRQSPNEIQMTQSVLHKPLFKNKQF